MGAAPGAAVLCAYDLTPTKHFATEVLIALISL